MLSLKSKDINFHNLRMKNGKFQRDFDECLNLTSSRIDSINLLLITKKIIPSFGEKVKLRIREYILSI